MLECQYMDEKHILIIEDESVLRNLLSEKLIKSGYRVSTASNGEEGLEKINENMPDLVLLDILMPKVDGFAVLEDLNRSGVIKTLPVVIISNSGQPVEIDRAIGLGIRDYLVKAEFSPEEVLEKVIKQIGSGGTVATKDEGVHKANAKSILIIEDDKFLEGLLARKLEKEKFAVTFATNGAEAFSKIKESLPDLILLDIILPDMNGFEILEILKKNQETKDIPVIILSNLGQNEDMEKSLKIGAVAHLIKAHFTPQEIVGKIESFLATVG